MTDRELLRAFFDCGDNDIVEFALVKARLNRHERTVMILLFDDCMTQEEVAENMHYSTRRVQDFWYSGAKKLLDIQWVRAYATDLIRS